jgi:hypothetical protein
VAAGASVATAGASVAGAPQAESTRLAKIKTDNITNSLFFIFLLLLVLKAF